MKKIVLTLGILFLCTTSFANTKTENDKYSGKLEGRCDIVIRNTTTGNIVHMEMNQGYSRSGCRARLSQLLSELNAQSFRPVEPKKLINPN